MSNDAEPAPQRRRRRNPSSPTLSPNRSSRTSRSRSLSSPTRRESSRGFKRLQASGCVPSCPSIPSRLTDDERSRTMLRGYISPNGRELWRRRGRERGAQRFISRGPEGGTRIPKSGRSRFSPCVPLPLLLLARRADEGLQSTYSITRPKSTRAFGTPIVVTEWAAWFDDAGKLMLGEEEAKKRIFQRVRLFPCLAGECGTDEEG